MPTLQRGTFALAIAIGFILVGANAVTPVFPGTIATPPVMLGLVLGYTVPVGFAAGTAPLLSAARSTGGLLLAVLATPVVMTLYALTGSLTPDFFGAVMRIQTFGHLPVFVLAGLAAGRISSRLHSEPGLAARVPGLRPIGTIAIGLLVVSAAVTVPLAYLDLDTVTYPSTVTPAEFQAATFAATHVDGAYATDTNQARSRSRSTIWTVSPREPMGRCSEHGCPIRRLPRGSPTKELSFVRSPSTPGSRPLFSMFPIRQQSASSWIGSVSGTRTSNCALVSRVSDRWRPGTPS